MKKLLITCVLFLGMVLNLSAGDFFTESRIVDNPSTRTRMLQNIFEFGAGLPDNDGAPPRAAGCVAFRIHKNWIMTAAHCMKACDDLSQCQGFANTDRPVAIRIIKKNNSTKISGNDDYAIVVMPVNESLSMPANGRVYFYKQNYNTASDTGHADDIALIKIEKPQAISFKGFLKSQGFAEDAIKQIPANTLRQMEGAIQPILSDGLQEFLNGPLANFNFLTLNESDVIDTLAPISNPKKYPFSQYRFQNDNVERFVIYSNGTKKNSNVLYFYPNVGQAGTSGSPIIYGNIIVSIQSGPNKKQVVGPMFHPERFHSFLTNTMGSDYPKGLCIKVQQNNSGETPIVKPVQGPTNPK